MACYGRFYTSKLWCYYTGQQNEYNIIYYDRYCSASDMYVTNPVSSYIQQVQDGGNHPYWDMYLCTLHFCKLIYVMFAL